LYTTVVHNRAQNSADDFSLCPPDNHHSSDDVYWREGGGSSHKDTNIPYLGNQAMDVVDGVIILHGARKASTTNILSNHLSQSPGDCSEYHKDSPATTWSNWAS